MGRRSEHTRSELQHLILDATTDLIEHVGVEGVTARMIADKIGYTPGMLYTAFESLPDILINVNNHSLETLNSQCVSAASESLSPQDSLLAVATAYSEFAAKHNHRFNMLFDHSVIRKRASTATITENMSGILDAIEKALLALTPDASPDSLRTGALSLWSAIHGACFLGVSNNWEKSLLPATATNALPSDPVATVSATENHADQKRQSSDGIHTVLADLIKVFSSGWVQQHRQQQ